MIGGGGVLFFLGLNGIYKKSLENHSNNTDNILIDAIIPTIERKIQANNNNDEFSEKNITYPKNKLLNKVKII